MVEGEGHEIHGKCLIWINSVTPAVFYPTLVFRFDRDELLRL